MKFLLCALVAALLYCAAPDACASPSPANAGFSDEVRRQITEILAQPEYNRVYPKPREATSVRTFLERLGKRVSNFFEWLRSQFGFKEGSAGRTASFIFASLVLFSFGFLVWVVLRRVAWSRSKRLEQNLPYELDDAYGLPSAGPLVREAARLAENGDYRGAFRCAYLASISHLDGVRALRFERSRTNWEYLRELSQGGHSAALESLRPVTASFDRKFYGREECDRKDYLEALSAYERIVSEVAA